MNDRADGQVTVVSHLDAETFEGTGLFEGIGNANGTGLFIGEGTFSGANGRPWFFSYKTGILAGTYNMIAMMPNGKEILLPDPVEVGLTASNTDMKLPGLDICRHSVTRTDEWQLARTFGKSDYRTIRFRH